MSELAACRHISIYRLASDDGTAVMWACRDCAVRFYPHGPESRRGCPDHEPAERDVAALREDLAFALSALNDPDVLGELARKRIRAVLANPAAAEPKP